MIPKNKKILNDPVYGFITIPDGIMYEIIHHPCFQRLRRIRQLGMTSLVYPGATHTRFLHTMGTFHLTMNAINTLKEKGIEISEKEVEAVLFAILLHDIGHGPFSHALENTIVTNIEHESLSVAFMKYFNKRYNGRLSMAIEIFNNTYEKHFLHSIISSQLDTDRLDYLKRDSFFTGVSEGVVSTDRIIKMFNVRNDELVVDIKGIYSVEKFLIARRLMYWQVYLHKTVVASEMMLRKIIARARQLTMSGETLWAPPALQYFLSRNAFEINDTLLDNFSVLDDDDVVASVKVWQHHHDLVISKLSTMYTNRQLFKIELQNKPFTPTEIATIKDKTAHYFNISLQETEYFVVSDILTNNAYRPDSGKISILFKDERVEDLENASDMFDHGALQQTVKKYFLCYPKELV
ncbi:MAG: HD domain-containing protein [Salinivirgaceae bacterium]|jgi:HD superfamily phosphohydrolase|nr:HD domain-containing protein [Salinivirgaceae bacterium]